MKDKMEIQMRTNSSVINYYDHGRVFLEIQFHEKKIDPKCNLHGFTHKHAELINWQLSSQAPLIDFFSSFFRFL